MTASAVRNAYWLTVGEVAEALDVTIRTVWKWTSAGSLPQPKRNGKKWVRWRRADINKFLASLG